MKIEHKVLTDKIHLLIFKTRLEIASTFLRFQEHYESPHFRGKIFTLEEFKEWYIRNSPKGIKTGKFTYFSDWGGFNIPSHVLEPFYAGKFDPLSMVEKNILDIFKNKKGEFYIIGINKQTKNLDNLLKHEIAHGLFATDSNYKKEVLSILSKFDIEPIKKELRSEAGYHEEVLDDEVHAYSLTSNSKLKTPIPKEMSKDLRILYDTYYK